MQFPLRTSTEEEVVLTSEGFHKASQSEDIILLGNDG